MKFLVASFLVLQLLVVLEIQSFDFVVEEEPKKPAELFDLETRGFFSSPQLRRGRSQRSTSNSEEEEELLLGDDKIILHSYKIQSTITSRMANTMVQTKVENRAKNSQNMVFDVQVPKGAFIHNFTMGCISHIGHKCISHIGHKSKRLPPFPPLNLQKFYNQVSTPLLKKLDFNYPKGLVSDVTQSAFQHYFKGSEIVVSGKVDTENVQHLQSVVTATASNTQLILDTLANVEGLDEFLDKDKHADPKFTEKLWAYLTVNQLMAERNVAPSAAMKRNITKAILQMSLDHHIVTPYTAMLIENPDGDELMLADSPQDRKRACCPGALTIGQPKPEKPISAWTQHGSQSALRGPTAATVHTGPIVIGREPTDNSIPSWANPTKKSGGPLPAIMGPTSAINAGSLNLGHQKSGNSSILSKNPDDSKRIHSVDNDPHFIITFPRQQKNICFNIDSQPGAILNLISDVESRITINGELIGAKRFLHNKLNTYFGKVGFHFEAKGLKVEVSPEAITLKDGSSTTSLSWSETGSLIRRRLLVSVKKESNVTLTVDGDLTFMVLLHRVWKKHPVNVDFLGIYIPPANNFSSTVHGLIGQFMQEQDVIIYNERPGQDPGKSDATMEVKGHKLTVTRGLQKDYRLDRVFGTNVQCWFVHNNGKGFLDGHYTDYLVPNLYSYLKHF
ncbi:inter-alpha-trypsin inhibitor heavy chain H2 [Notechis scutatus]|uniref:Inter-alpha-trypsin inhibitor heavy chain H2 n=1 Tax=Notechis scutatus TaxID=8663 RepID=A0A6J1V8Z7_9SAUR|nr:inter-alpha-trypsin inhibitor heavy chain H2 [Notechis scutatus]